MAVVLFMDCGAPSLYNRLSRTINMTSGRMGSHFKQRHRDDYSYVETEEYKTYRQAYCDFLKEFGHTLDIYSNLDVIHNAELTWKNQKWFEKRGVKPWPVWHLGSDTKWLERYLEEYDTLCFGGIVNLTGHGGRSALDTIWSKFLTDKDGLPRVKVHGFAMTGFDLMYRYPWYSVDSKSWIDFARYGWILVPPRSNNGGDFNWMHPSKVMASNVMLERRIGGETAGPKVNRRPRADTSLRCAPGPIRRLVDDLLKVVGVPVGVSEFKNVPVGYKRAKNEVWMWKPSESNPGRIETVKEPGVTNSYVCRMDVNCFVFKQIERQLPKWPWAMPKLKASTNTGLFTC